MEIGVGEQAERPTRSAVEVEVRAVGAKEMGVILRLAQSLLVPVTGLAFASTFAGNREDGGYSTNSACVRAIRVNNSGIWNGDEYYCY